MDEYAIYCTEAQTKRALNLGAPLEIGEGKGTILCRLQNYHTYKRCVIPTAEQMIGWLEEKIYNIFVVKNKNGTWFYMIYWENSLNKEIKSDYATRKEATLAAIDEALEYLENLKQ